MRVFILALLAATAVYPSSDAVAQTMVAEQPVQNFSDKASALVAKYGVPGASVAVYTDSGLIAAIAVGKREIGKPAPLRLTDRFAIASNAKPMTATLAAILVERRLIAWTSTPAQLWPSDAASMHPSVRDVTLAQLLSNSAGILPLTDDKELAQVPAISGTPREQRATFARWLVQQPASAPRGKFTYSNAGFALAGAMIEAASGQSWDDLLRKELFEPLAMASCRSGRFDPDGAAVPHRREGNAYLANPKPDGLLLPEYLAPAGLIACSTPDLARFGEAHLLGLAGRHPLLPQATFQRLHRNMPGTDYGLGWNVEPSNSQHRGGLDGRWHSLLIVAPSSRLVVATAVNARSVPQTMDLMAELAQAAFDEFGSRKAR